jgi:hypothetical protein
MRLQVALARTEAAREREIAVPPVDRVRRRVLLGALPALVFAISQSGEQFEISKECKGAFGAGFSNGFDRHRCDLIIRHATTGAKVKLPLG